MMKDRPQMAAHIDESSPVWKWTVRAFAGEGLSDTVDWSGEDPSSGTAEHSPMHRESRGIVRVGTADNKDPNGKPFTAGQLWSMLIFELHNLRQSAVSTQYLTVEAMQGHISEEEFVRRSWESEERACQEQRAFFLHVYLPYASEKGLEVDWSFWRVDTSWGPLSELFARYTDKDRYPWVPYAAYYRRLVDPDQDGKPGLPSSLKEADIETCRWHLIRDECVEALKQCEAVLRRDEGNLDARYCHAAVLFLRRNYEPAIAECDEVLKEDPDKECIRELRGFALLQAGRIEEGIAELKWVHDHSPKWAYPNASYGYALAHQGKLKDAIEYCNRGVAANPKLAPTYFFRAFVRFKQGKCAQAIADCTKAIELDPNSDLALDLRANAYEKLGRKEEARKDREEAKRLVANRLEKRPEPTPSKEKGSILGALGKSLGGLFGSDTPAKETSDERMEALTDAIKASPDEPEPYVKRGYEYLFREDYRDALDDCKEAIRLDKNNKAALGLRQRIFVRIDREEDALKDCNHLIDDLGCKDPAVFGNRAAIRLRNGDYDAAAEDLKKAISLNPDDPARDYVAWRKEELSDEMLAYGEEQVRRMLKDRPAMAEHVEASDPLWRWAARAFAGEGLPEAVEWSPEPTRWFPAEHRPISPGKRGIIQLEAGSDAGELFTGDRMWAMLILEFHKMRRSSLASMYPRNLAIQGSIREEEYVRRFWEFDAEACKDLHRFFLEVYLPHAKEKGFEVDPSAWKIDDFWDPLPELFKRYTDEDEYPWYPYGSYYRHYVGRDEEPRMSWESETTESMVHECHRLVLKDKVAEALEQSELILRRDEENVAARYCRAVVRRLQRDFAGAVEECDAALAKDPDAYHVRELRGVCLVKIGRIDDGAADLEKVLKHLPKWPSPNSAYGYALAQQGKLEEAMTYCDKAVAMQPGLGRLHFHRACVYFKRGDYAKTVEDCTRAIDVEFFPDLALDLRADAYEKLGEKEKAAADRKKAHKMLVKRLPED